MPRATAHAPSTSEFMSAYEELANVCIDEISQYNDLPQAAIDWVKEVNPLVPAPWLEQCNEYVTIPVPLRCWTTMFPVAS